MKHILAIFLQLSFLQILAWRIRTPERYALLSVFTGLRIEELFGAEIPVENPALAKLLEYKDRGLVYRRADLIEAGFS